MVMSYDWGEVTDRFADYLVVPPIMLWLGAAVLIAPLLMAWRSVGPWVWLTSAPAITVAVLVVVFSALFALPCPGSVMWSCRAPSLTDSVTLGGIVAATSLPVWVHYGVATLVKRRSA